MKTGHYLDNLKCKISHDLSTTVISGWLCALSIALFSSLVSASDRSPVTSTVKRNNTLLIDIKDNRKGPDGNELNQFIAAQKDPRSQYYAMDGDQLIFSQHPIVVVITKEEKAPVDMMDYIQNNPSWVPGMCMLGSISPEDINQYSNLPKNIQKQVALAFMNGLNLNELNRYVISKTGIRSRDIEILTSRAAVELVSITPRKSEMKMLELVASKYCNEENLEANHAAEARNCLLLYLDPCLFKYRRLSELAGGPEEETKNNILSAYLEKYNLTSLPIKVTHDNISEFLDTIIKYGPTQSHLKNIEHQLNIEKLELEPKLYHLTNQPL